MSTPELSLVVPAYNETEVLPVFHQRARAALDKIGLSYEIVYVDDGSTDETLTVLRDLHLRDPNVVVLALSRNFGKEIALTAGLDAAHGDVVVVIDADLQDPPELMVEMVAQWRRGYDVVYARRTKRDGETWVKRLTAHLFYRTIARVSRVSIPEDAGDFRLMSRRAVDAVRSLREQHRYMKGLFAWVGYPQIAVDYQRAPRAAGTTKWNYWRLWNLALEGLTSFTTAPLKIATYLGLSVATVAFVYAGWIVYKTLVFGEIVRGYPTIMVIMLMLGGLQLLFIGVIGEYLGRVFDEAKRRPLYFVSELLPSSREAGSSVAPAGAVRRRPLPG